MNPRPDALQQYSLAAHKPSILYTQHRAFRIGFPRKPALELMPDIAQAPKIHFLVIDLDMRPSPVKAPMVLVILWEIVGQNLSVKAVDGMKVRRSGLGVWRALARHHTMIVNKDRVFTFPKLQRLVVDGLKAKLLAGGSRFLCSLIV